MVTLQMFDDSPETLAFYRMRLPHWEVEGGQYFVTIRLHGSLPKEVLSYIKRLKESADLCQNEIESLKFNRQIFKVVENSLHRNQECNLLTKGSVPKVISEAVGYYQQKGIWNVYEYVIMPNHLHLFFGEVKESLRKVIGDFKHWTTREINKVCGSKGKQIWQREWFDHWSRSSDYDERFCEYIRNNPVKAGLCKNYKEWKYGSW